MSGNCRPARRKGPDPETLAPDVHQAMRGLGWIVPQSDEDVRQAEGEPAAALPDGLENLDAVFAGTARRPQVVHFQGDRDVDATLARAARECGHLTPETEEAMRRDREAAEREMDDEEPA